MNDPRRHPEEASRGKLSLHHDFLPGSPDNKTIEWPPMVRMQLNQLSGFDKLFHQSVSHDSHAPAAQGRQDHS
jgi:hypothetical protein